MRKLTPAFINSTLNHLDAIEGDGDDATLNALGSYSKRDGFGGIYEELYSYGKPRDASSSKGSKHRIPRKRASKILSQLNDEMVAKSKGSKPLVFENDDYAAGDAIEVVLQSHFSAGSLKEGEQKVRGVVLGRVNRGYGGTSVMIRDVVNGGVVERQLPLHSPTVKSVKVLKKNFIRSKKQFRRSKLFYLREKPDGLSRVSNK